MALPNILLFFVGYHFYEIDTESAGVGDYILVSKRGRIRNKADVKTVMRVFAKIKRLAQNCCLEVTIENKKLVNPANKKN